MGQPEDGAHPGADDSPPAYDPPPYSAVAGATGSNSPPPDIAAAFSGLNLANEHLDTPTPEGCLAHLKLLYAIRGLREEVGYTDGLWGIRDPDAGPEVTQEMMSKLREKRWAIYLARAVDRYEAWWASLEGRDLTLDDMRARSSTAHELFPYGGAGAGMAWDEKMLIPLGE